MISFSLLVIGAIAVVIGAILRPLFGRWIDARNISQLRRHHDLDEATAAELYRLARRDGFGSAWETVVDGRRTDDRRRTEERRAAERAIERRRTADRRLAGRPRA